MRPSGISKRKSVEQIVNLINESNDKEMLAADYAYDEIANAGEYTSEDILDRLGFLKDAGAQFNLLTALRSAEGYLAMKQDFERMMANFKRQIYFGGDVDYLQAWKKDRYVEMGNELINELKEYLEWVEENEK